MQIIWTHDLDAACAHAVLAAQRGLSFVDAPFARAICAASRSERLARCRSMLAPDGATAFAEQLRLRSGPLREQWDARGPGLMRQLNGNIALSDDESAITVAPVPPMVGGHGEVFPGDRQVTIEAVLANPCAELPEVLRLAWLLARLVSRADTRALVAAVLAAGEAVELTHANSQTLDLAIATWRPSTEQN